MSYILLYFRLKYLLKLFIISSLTHSLLKSPFLKCLKYNFSKTFFYVIGLWLYYILVRGCVLYDSNAWDFLRFSWLIIPSSFVNILCVLEMYIVCAVFYVNSVKHVNYMIQIFFININFCLRIQWKTQTIILVEPCYFLIFQMFLLYC